MRFPLRISVLVLVLLVLSLPVAAFAADGPCPDDPVAFENCYDETPPYFVVINRSVEEFDRPATGCQPIILAHPECEDCTAAECDIDIQTEVCQYLPAAAGDLLYALCCNCAVDPDGEWMYRIYELDGLGGCALEQDWTEGLPPGTGIDLPAPFVVGGLAVFGIALLAVGLVIRRKSFRFS